MLKYRHPSAEDLPKLNEWVAADPDHASNITGEFFLLKPDEKGVQCIEVQDDAGTIFYLKFTNAVLIDAEFPPNADKETRARVRKGLEEAFGYFHNTLKKLGYHAMLFDSVSPSLVRFFKKLGFKRLTDFFRVAL